MDIKRISLLFSMLFAAMIAPAQNPYLPMWEYIPDGEPYVFEDPDCPGKYRVYIYGSHDSLVDSYCGREQVVWSAPVDDLTNWRYDGVIFKSVVDGKGDVLFAPDVALKKDKDGRNVYYLYPNNQEWGRNGMVARSLRPDGPFVAYNWNKENPKACDGDLGFDPAVFVDDDGRVYGYWGFGESYGAEFDPETMATVKPGCQPVHNMVSGQHQEGIFKFFEASSMRKIKDKYVFIYSRMMPEGEFGMPQCNYNLAFAYSDSPLGPFTYGGTLIDARARETGADGVTRATANPYGNTHGSLCEINGKWWVFYHRQTGTDEYSRQAMVAPVAVEVEEGPGGKVTISEAEYNSEGFRTEGLDPLQRSAAGWACYLTNPKGIGQDYPHFIFSGSYIRPTRLDTESCQGPFNLKLPFCPVVNNTSGSVVGYKYFNFDRTYGARNIECVARIKPEGVRGTVSIYVGGSGTKAGGKRIGRFEFDGNETQQVQEFRTKVNALSAQKGKQALYFVFKSDVGDASICELYDFIFEIKD